MIDFNDFEPMGESSNPISEHIDLNIQDKEPINDMFTNLNNPKIDEEEQKRIENRQKEADERKARISKKMQEEEEARIEIRKKAAEYLTEFNIKRQEEIAKKRKQLEEKELNSNKEKNSNGTSDSWTRVSGNIDLKDSEYKGTKDVQRMREAMMNRQNDPNSEPLQKFFG